MIKGIEEDYDEDDQEEGEKRRQSETGYEQNEGEEKTTCVVPRRLITINRPCLKTQEEYKSMMTRA